MKMTPRTLVQSSVGFLASGVFAAALLAGPGPQYWNRPAATAAPKSEAASNTEALAAAKCDGCKTTPIWVVSERGPAGKGVPGTRVVGSQHACVRCVGVNTVEHGKAKNAMMPGAACGPLMCCK